MQSEEDMTLIDFRKRYEMSVCVCVLQCKERRMKQNKELLEAAKGSGSLSSWFMKSSTGKNTTCSLPFLPFFTLQRHSMLDYNNNYDSDEDNNKLLFAKYQGSHL